MTRTLYDATHQLVGNIPPNAQMVAGYLSPSPFAWTDADWARFPNAVHVRIAVRAATDDGHVLDVERGDATPAQAPGWVTMRRAAGADPSVYCSSSVWPTIQAQFTRQGVAQPHYWIAAYPGAGAVIPTGAVAHQYQSTSKYDVSVVADFWPGVDGEPDVNLTDSIGHNTNGDAVTVGEVLGLLYSALADSKAAPKGQTLYDVLWATAAAVQQTDADAVKATTAATKADVDLAAAVATLTAAVQAEGTPEVSQTALAAALSAANVGPAVAEAFVELLSKAGKTS